MNKNQSTLWMMVGMCRLALKEDWNNNQLKIFEDMDKLLADGKDKYEKGFNILMEYFDSISDEERPKVHELLKELDL